jgi:hypothetical protein
MSDLHPIKAGTTVYAGEGGDEGLTKAVAWAKSRGLTMDNAKIKKTDDECLVILKKETIFNE